MADKQLIKSILSSYFVNKPGDMMAELGEAFALLHNREISNIHDLLPLLVVTEAVEDGALAPLVVNTVRGIIKVAAVKAPRFGDRRKAILPPKAIGAMAGY